MTTLDPTRDRIVAVTGAGTGIGQATAVEFGSLGWQVAVGGRRVDKLAETAELVQKAGGNCLPHELAATSPAREGKRWGSASI
jgi:NADP-dependent 3-hydroxy acid dehydrogenase YdfG